MHAHISSVSASYLKGKVVALDHGLAVVLLQRGQLRLLHLRLKLRGEHVVHSVDGGVDLTAQLKGFILSVERVLVRWGKGRGKHKKGSENPCNGPCHWTETATGVNTCTRVMTADEFLSDACTQAHL